MPTRRKSSDPKGVVILVGKTADGCVAEETTMSVVDYYEELHPMLDDASFIRRNAIRTVWGRIYDYGGVLDQEFENEYDGDGVRVRGWTKFADGTCFND